MITIVEIEAARAFVDRISSPARRAYAEAWLEYRLHGAEEPAPSQLTFMATKSIRNRVDYYLGLEE